MWEEFPDSPNQTFSLGFQILKCIKVFFLSKVFSSFLVISLFLSQWLILLFSIFFNVVSYSDLQNLFFLPSFLFWKFVTFIRDNNHINPDILTTISKHCTSGTLIDLHIKGEAVPPTKKVKILQEKVHFCPFPIQWLATYLKSEMIQIIRHKLT